MFKKKSVIKEWFFSYVLILMVPLVAVFINYYYNINTMEKEIQQANKLVLNNLKNNVDSYLDAQRRMYFYFYNNEGFSNLVYSQSMDAWFYAEAREYHKQLNAYNSSNDKLSYWLYLEEQDYFITSSTTGSNKTFYARQRTYGTDFPQWEEWQEFLEGNYDNEYLISDILFQNKVEDSLILANTYSYYGEHKANIFVTIPVSYIQELTRTLTDGALFLVCFANEDKEMEEQYLVMNSQGVIEFPKTINVSQMAAGNGLFEIENYIAFSEPAANSGISYFLLIPKETFWEEAGNIRNVHLSSIIATLLVGIILVVFLLRKNFLPVTGILQMIERDNQEGNEFERIKSAYGIIRKENHVMKSTMKSYKKSMCSSYLLAMLKGRIGRDCKRELEIGWNPPEKNGMLVLVGIDIPLKEDAQEDELSFFIVDNVMTELFQGEDFYYVEDGRVLFYLFSITEGKKEQWKSTILEKTNYLCDFMEEKMQLSLSVVISSPEKDISRVKYLYQSVMETFEYKQIIGGSGSVTTDEWFEKDEDGTLHVTQKILIQALENGKLEDAYRASDRLFDIEANTPFIVLRLQVLETFQLISDAYNRITTDAVKRMQLMEWLDALLSAKNVFELKMKYDKMLEFAHARMAGQWKTESGGIVSIIKELVEENYMDSSLNVSTIAVQMQKNPQYISKVFKNETGEGILDYINVLRIRKAQEILLTRKISMEKVAEMVGYASVRTFRRNFARVMGMTPSGYLDNE